MNKRDYKKIKKQKLWIYLKTLTILFVFGIIIFTGYSYTVIKSEKEILTKQADADFLDLYSNIVQAYAIGNPPTVLNTSYLVHKYTDSNTYISVNSVNNENDNRCEKSDNTLALCFNKNSFGGIYGILKYSNLKSSVSNKDYKEIVKYTSIAPQGKKNKRFELLCTEFCINKNNEIFPEKLQLVETDDDNIWYVQDKVIKTYSINSNNNNRLEHYKCDEMSRNVIDKDFILNKKKFYTPDEKLIDGIKEKNVKKTGLFSYIYTNVETFYSVTNEYVIDDYKTPQAYITVKTAKRIDLLSQCSNRIITMFIYIAGTFLFVGLLLSTLFWRSFKKQTELEQRQIDFINAMAHDLKTPIFIISGYAENLVENIHTEKKELYAEKILKQTRTIDRQLHNMLNSSKISKNQISLSKENFSLSLLLMDMVNEYKEIGCDIKLSCTEDVIINADKDLIKCAITNLVDNAIKYTADKNSISVNLTDKEFSISNKCENIKKSQLKKLWEPYYMIDTNSRKNGNGLGLSIVKNISDLHKFKYGVNVKNNIINFKISFR